MPTEQTFGEAARRSFADWYSDMRLRSNLNHWETKDLMRSDYARPRDLVPMPTRVRSPKTPVKRGYVVGSRADAVASILGLTPIGEASRPFGEVRYVEGPKPKVGADGGRPRSDALASRLDAEASRAERLRAFTDQLRTAGTIVLGQMD